MKTILLVVLCIGLLILGCLKGLEDARLMMLSSQCDGSKQGSNDGQNHLKATQKVEVHIVDVDCEDEMPHTNVENPILHSQHHEHTKCPTFESYNRVHISKLILEVNYGW